MIHIQRLFHIRSFYNCRPPHSCLFSCTPFTYSICTDEVILVFISGAALHLHDLSITSLNWVIQNATYMNDLYFCNSSDATSSLRFDFFRVPPTVQSSTCSSLWRSVTATRKELGEVYFDKW